MKPLQISLSPIASKGSIFHYHHEYFHLYRWFVHSRRESRSSKQSSTAMRKFFWEWIVLYSCTMFCMARQMSSNISIECWSIASIPNCLSFLVTCRRSCRLETGTLLRGPFRQSQIWHDPLPSCICPYLPFSIPIPTKPMKPQLNVNFN